MELALNEPQWHAHLCWELERFSAEKKEVEQIPQASEKNPLTAIKAF